VKYELTFVSIVPIQSVQADHRQLVRDHVDGEISSSLEDVVILCGDIVAPDAVIANKNDVYLGLIDRQERLKDQ
jgi:hypothetical protein